QTVCDYWDYFWSYLQDAVSVNQSTFGTSLRVLVKVANPAQPNGIGNAGANIPANGSAPGGDNLLLGGNPYLHVQPYGAAVDNQGHADCEAGQRGYPQRLNYFDPQHRNLATDVHTPGDQGPTFAGRSKVPAG